MNLPALTPAAGGGMCIDTAALKPADIIVSTTHDLDSWFIRAFTFSQVSHASLYVGKGDVIEAVGQGVRRSPIAKSLAHDSKAVVYRYKNLPDEAAAKIVSYVNLQVKAHMQYDMAGAVGAGANSSPFLCVVALNVINPTMAVAACLTAASGALNNKDRFFCSELVTEAFRQAGYPITNTAPGVASPERIVEAYSHGVLEYIGDLITG